MKITTKETRSDERSRIKGRARSSSVSAGKETFESELVKNLEFEFRGTVDELLMDLKEQEKRFLDQQSLYELEKYKSIVKKILKLVSEGSFETRTLKRTRRDRADFTVVEIVNKKLLELSQAVTKGNKAFNFMKTIEEIRGLVFDLVY